MTDSPETPRPTGIPEHSYLVLTQIDYGNEVPVVRGVFASLKDLKEVAALYLEDLCVDEEGDDFIIVPLVEHHHEIRDMNIYATGELILVVDGGDRVKTGMYVWDSARKREAYTPLKLYWCTTPDAEEDWFVIEHSAHEAAVRYAEHAGYDITEPRAEFVMNLPEEYQSKGDEILGWPESETLLACGARFLRHETPRVIELAGRTFAEGLFDGGIVNSRAACGLVVVN